MLKLHIPPLGEQHQADLQALQDKVNQQADYAAQVAYAKEHWRKKPAALFADHLKPQLAAPLSGNSRCVYCEDSLADEIEHMRPKDFFPEQTYAWDNYVLACGPCNGSYKRNQFALLLANGELHELHRPRGSAVTPPPAGDYALLDPRVDNPLDFLWLDLNTGRYAANSDDEDSPQAKRADYTIKILGLNDRDTLVRGRKAALSGYLARLKHWCDEREAWTEAKRQSWLQDFHQERYRSVWAQLVRRYRQQRLHADSFATAAAFIECFSRAPEALDW